MDEPATEETIFAMHQPNYLPWLGFFHKMAHTDVFVYLDLVQMPRGQSFAARNKVKTPQGATWLTVPVSVPSGQKGKALYTEVSFADESWKKNHLKTLKFNYTRSDHFEEIFELYREIVESASEFVEMNIALIDAFADYLNIDTERVRQSELGEEFGQKNQLIIELADRVGANVYLSGTGGGKEYNDPEVLGEHGIGLRYSDFEHPRYEQLWDDFESHLSIIDLLFNHGPGSRQILLGT
jgi:hypothetical protein